MGTFTVPLFSAIVMVILQAVASSVDVNADNHFQPMVAFICNKPAMHRGVNGWIKDEKTDCLDNAEDILNYCKTVYPDHDITNVMQSSHMETISNWCKLGHAHCHAHGNHTVQPFRCLVGAFQSDALLVPEHCTFKHDHNISLCYGFQQWNDTAKLHCVESNMKMQSFAMLLPCQTDMFSGVEFVCCPDRDAHQDPDVSNRVAAPVIAIKKISDDEDDYLAYLKGDKKFLAKYKNEHQQFKAAEKLMQKHHHDKISNMMKDWTAARDRVREMKKTDPRGAELLNKQISMRYQKMYRAYEQEGQAEKKQLGAVHQQHVQRVLNEKKATAMDRFMAELQQKDPEASVLLHALRLYVRAEEKDRTHTINHYEHMRDTDPEEARTIRPKTIEHIDLIDKRLNQSLEMLHNYPDLEKKVRPQIEKFMTEYRGIDASVAKILLRPITQSTQEEYLEQYREQEMSKDLGENETPLVSIDMNSDSEDLAGMGNDALISKIKDFDPETMEDEHAYEKDEEFIAHSLNHRQSADNSIDAVNIGQGHAGSVFGIAIGSVAVFVIVIVAIVMVKKRNRRPPVTHGFVEVDPAASPEERHVANMQMNGYENPTYKYFEGSQQ